MPSHLLTNFEKQTFHQNEPKLNGFYLGNNSPKIKLGAYVINVNEQESIGTRWIALSVNGDNLTYFNSLKVEYIPKEIKENIDNKNIAANIYRIQANDSMT